MCACCQINPFFCICASLRRLRTHAKDHLLIRMSRGTILNLGKVLSSKGWSGNRQWNVKYSRRWCVCTSALCTTFFFSIGSMTVSCSIRLFFSSLKQGHWLFDQTTKLAKEMKEITGIFCDVCTARWFAWNWNFFSVLRQVLSNFLNFTNTIWQIAKRICKYKAKYFVSLFDETLLHLIFECQSLPNCK